jgi:ubiquinone/menaquinone biosynthesis C-methylase UbiE
MAGGMRNLDEATVAGFGQEWSEYDQAQLGAHDLRSIFESYFAIFPFDELPPKAEGFDLGCGSGRWADLVLPKVGHLHCIDASEVALNVARHRLAGRAGAIFHHASVDEIPLADDSQDFGYSLGVLHHVPDTGAAMAACVRKLKPGAPFLVYLYHSFDNRPFWYRPLWAASDVARKGISRLPFTLRKTVTSVIAALVYWPLARTASLAERIGRNVVNYPLSIYRDRDFYVMRTDALDRFGTRLEHRFSRAEIERMMLAAGLEQIRFSERPPFWVACGRRSK